MENIEYWTIYIFQASPCHSILAKFMGPTWGPPGSCRPQMGPMLAPWTLLSGMAGVTHCGQCCVAIWRQRPWSSVVHIMVCHLIGTKPLAEPMMTCRQLHRDPINNMQTLVQIMAWEAIRRQIITWANDDIICWRINAPLGPQLGKRPWHKQTIKKVTPHDISGNRELILTCQFYAHILLTYRLNLCSCWIRFFVIVVS